MKKIFYFIASAIVALGAVACQNQFDEEFTPNTQNEGLSFTAAIDEETRITFNGAVTSWEAGDCIMINGYEFICTNGSSFSCTANGVRSLIGKEIEAVYSYNNNGYVDSKQAEKGAVLKATGTMLEANTTLTFSPQSAYLNFTSMQGTVVLRGKGLFVVDGETVDTFTVENKYGAQYVAINPTNEEIEFSYTYGGEPGKTILKKFVAGNVYKLGTLSAPVAEVDGVRYTDLNKALAAAGTTKVVTLLANATVKQQCIINENGKTLTISGDFAKTSKKGDGYAYVYPTSQWKIVGNTDDFGNWAYGSSKAVMLKEHETVVVIRNITLAADNEFKFCKDGTWADGTHIGAYGDGGTGDISYNSWYGVDKRWGEFKANIKNTKADTYDLFFATDSGSWYVAKSSDNKEVGNF